MKDHKQPITKPKSCDKKQGRRIAATLTRIHSSSLVIQSINKKTIQEVKEAYRKELWYKERKSTP